MPIEIVSSGADRAFFGGDEGRKLSRVKLEGLKDDSRFFVAVHKERDIQKASWFTKRTHAYAVIEGEGVLLNINSLAKRLLLSKSQIREAEKARSLGDLLTNQARTLAVQTDEEIKGIHYSNLGDAAREQVASNKELFGLYAKSEFGLKFKKSGEHTALTFRALQEIAVTINAVAKSAQQQHNFGVHIEEIQGTEYLFQPYKVKDVNGKETVKVHVVEYDVRRELGSGTEGIVSRVTLVTGGIFMAMKRPKKLKYVANIEKEASKTEQLHARGLGAVVQAIPILIKWSLEGVNDVAMISPIYQTASAWIKENQSLDHRIHFCQSLMEADATAWAKNISHGDIKPINLFVHEGRVIFGDLSGAEDATIAKHWGLATLAYMSTRDMKAFEEARDQPRRTQILQQRSVMADGVSMYQVFMGDPTGAIVLKDPRAPTPDKVRKELTAKNVPTPIIDLICRMVDPNPDTRISLQEAIEAWQNIRKQI